MKTLVEFNRWLEEEDNSKPEFNFEQFSNLQTRVEAVRYLVRTKIKKLGSGTFRATFHIDAKRVIKVATMDEGIEHNRREVQHAECIGQKYAVKVLDHHPEFWWLIEERAELLEDEQFVKLFLTSIGVNGQDFEFFDDMDVKQSIELAQSGRTTSRYKQDFVFDKLFKANRTWLNTSLWYRGLIASLKQCQVGSDDFGTNNWGVRPETGQLILIDLGF